MARGKKVVSHLGHVSNGNYRMDLRSLLCPKTTLVDPQSKQTMLIFCSEIIRDLFYAADECEARKETEPVSQN